MFLTKHSEELGGGITGFCVYLFKYLWLGERLWQDVHTLIMAGLSAIIGYFSVMAVRNWNKPKP